MNGLETIEKVLAKIDSTNLGKALGIFALSIAKEYIQLKKDSALGIAGNFPDLVTREEAGEYFRVNPKTVDVWASRGLLTRHRTPNGRIRFDKREFVKLDTPIEVE